MEFPSRQIITGAYMRQVGEIASLTKIITFYCCLLIIEKYQLDMDKEMLIVDQQV
jgi:D-alanyl-D-alanine carboxypeptidase